MVAERLMDYKDAIREVIRKDFYKNPMIMELIIRIGKLDKQNIEDVIARYLPEDLRDQFIKDVNVANTQNR